MTTKLDLYKMHKAEYAAPTKPALVRTKPALYLTIAGQGAPGGSRFTAGVAALYGAAFTIKMTRKVAGKQDYAVCKLEGLWFFGGEPDATPKEEWQWKLMMRTPHFIAQEDLRTAVDTLLKRGKSPGIAEVKLETIDEGVCVQMLHVGPYESESATVALMRSFAESNGLKLSGPHHEIYLSDPRRVPPERLKTILRQPAIKRNS